MTNGMRTAGILLMLCLCAALGAATGGQGPNPGSTERVLSSSDFEDGKLDGWIPYGAGTRVSRLDGRAALLTEGDTQLFLGDERDRGRKLQDVAIEGEVSVDRNDASSGFIVRAARIDAMASAAVIAPAAASSAMSSTRPATSSRAVDRLVTSTS